MKIIIFYLLTIKINNYNINHHLSGDEKVKKDLIGYKMDAYKGFGLSKRIFCSVFLIFFVSCIDPVEPVFENEEGLIYIDAFLSTTPGASFVTVSESVFEFEGLKFELLKEVQAIFHNIETGLQIPLSLQTNVYLPPNDFAAESGSLWELSITLPDGRVYKSNPERITTAVPIKDIRSTYNPELEFRENQQQFLPGHFISIDLDDPADQENYYLWRFTSFENLVVCQNCSNSIYRNGECQENPLPQSNDYSVDYLCEENCWLKRYNENISIFSDEFSNGSQITALPVSDVLLYSKENIVVEVQQFSLTPKAYEYYKVLKDIVDNNGGLNAPPPAALVGNMFNPQNDDEFVLGRFTAAATTTKSIFINRENIDAPPIDEFGPLRLETCTTLCLPNQCSGVAAPCNAPVITSVSCSESQFRTALQPNGWVE